METAKHKHTHLVNRTEWQIPFNRYDDINDGHVRVNVQQKHTFEAHADLEQTNVERKQIKLLLYMKYLFRSQLHSCATKRIYQENRKSVLRSLILYNPQTFEEVETVERKKSYVDYDYLIWGDATIACESLWCGSLVPFEKSPSPRGERIERQNACYNNFVRLAG